MRGLFFYVESIRTPSIWLRDALAGLLIGGAIGYALGAAGPLRDGAWLTLARSSTWGALAGALGGALGLMLGTLGLAVVLVRTVIERKSELALLASLGFSSARTRSTSGRSRSNSTCCSRAPSIVGSTWVLPGSCSAEGSIRRRSPQS